MADPIKLLCDNCGEMALVEVNSYIGQDGKRIEWPKAEIREGQMCFSIVCPKCGTQTKCLEATT